MTFSDWPWPRGSTPWGSSPARGKRWPMRVTARGCSVQMGAGEEGQVAIWRNKEVREESSAQRSGRKRGNEHKTLRK